MGGHLWDSVDMALAGTGHQDGLLSQKQAADDMWGRIAFQGGTHEQAQHDLKDTHHIVANIWLQG